jgi:hypothetical protein
MIPRLPYWILTEKHPAFLETESKTAVEMVSRVYGKVQEIVDDYNKFVDIINKTIEDYETNTNQDLNCFKENLTKIVHDYIATLDMKVDHQDRQIEETVSYFKDNVKQAMTDIINEMKESGELENAIVNAFDNLGGRVAILENSKVKMTYDSFTESINFENVGGDIDV